MCTKVSFLNEKFALLYVEKLKKTSCRERIPVRAYLCEKCMCWHLTSTTVIDHESQQKIICLTNEIKNLKAKLADYQAKTKLLKSL